MQYVFKKMWVQLNGLVPLEETFMDFMLVWEAAMPSRSWKCLFPIPPSILSTKRCSEQECVASEWCWGQPMFKKSSFWRSALGFVMYFPDLPSLKYLLSWLLGELPQIVFSFQPLQRLPQLWRAVLSEVTPLPEVASIHWLIDMGAKRHGYLGLPHHHFMGKV